MATSHPITILTPQQREGAVLQLHDDSVQHGQHGRDVQQDQDDGLEDTPGLALAVAPQGRGPASYLLLPKHVSLGDAVQQGVGDLAGGAGHHHTEGFSLHGQAAQTGIKATNAWFAFPQQTSNL